MEKHASALSILTKLSEYLRSFGRIPSREKREILDYMDALGQIIALSERFGVSPSAFFP